MKVIELNEQTLDSFLKGNYAPHQRLVAALGFFDGVHKAHKVLFEQAKKEAERIGALFAVFTFSGENKIKNGEERLFSDAERLGFFEKFGADLVVLSDFSVIRNFEKEDFVKKILIGGLNTELAVFGFNFRFGKGASGNADDLVALMQTEGKGTKVIEEIKEGENTVSSTAVRTALSHSDPTAAARLLGSPYFIKGKVAHGLGLGRKLGFPTVNTDLSGNGFKIPRGVYFTAVTVGEMTFPALTNVGLCPTFEERELHAETYILDFSEDIYGKDIRIHFIDFLREEKVFDSAEELIMQINIDKNKVLELSKEIKWQEIGLNLQ